MGNGLTRIGTRERGVRESGRGDRMKYGTGVQDMEQISKSTVGRKWIDTGRAVLRWKTQGGRSSWPVTRAE